MAVGLWTLVLAGAVAVVAMRAEGWRGAGTTSSFSAAAQLLAFLAFSTMGALLVVHLPRNALGWIFLAIPLGAALGSASEILAFHGLVDAPGSIPAATAAAWIYSWAWYPTITLVAFVLFLFPTGSAPSRRWRRLGCALWILLGLMTLRFMSYPGPLDKDVRLPRNPLGIGWVKDVALGGDVAVALTVAVIVGSSVAALLVRFRRSRGDERQQMKWMALAGVVLGLGALVNTVGNFSDVVFALTISQVPVALGIAVFKYRLYDIDRVINRTVVYGASSALLAGVYAGLVLGGQALFASIAGGSRIAIAISTLVVAGLFLPVRRRVQRVVDRRFYRRRYDAERTLEAFASRLRDPVELERLQADLLDVVRETMQPADASLWLRNDPVTIDA